MARLAAMTRRNSQGSDNPTIEIKIARLLRKGFLT
jgi:hypothetical protein